MVETVDRLKELAAKHKLVKVYGPADRKMVMRRFSKIPGHPDQDLSEFYEHSNGASVLDYCIVGCKNSRIADLEYVRDGIYVQDWQRDRSFVPFVVSSVGEFFGYLVSSDPIRDSPIHPVSYCRDPENDSPTVIASSVGKFLHGLLEDAEEQLSRDPESVSIEFTGWPCDLNHWQSRDPELATYYCNERDA